MQNIYNIIVHLNKTVDKINRNTVKWQILFIYFYFTSALNDI